MHSSKANMRNVRNIRNCIPTPTLEITTAAVFNPTVTVELVPGVSGGGKYKNTKSTGYVAVKSRV